MMEALQAITASTQIYVPNQVELAAVLQVRLVQDAEERLKKDLRIMNRSTSASKLPTTEEQARIRKQMEADRLERSSKKG